jgi:hypothetical protein
MASLANIPIAPEIENPEEEQDIPIAQAVDVETLIRQKSQEITDCIEECNRLRRELRDFKNLCTAGGECSWKREWYGSHGIKECTKCGRTEVEYSKGGRRKSRRKSRKRKSHRRRKSKKRKTKRRRRN